MYGKNLEKLKIQDINYDSQERKHGNGIGIILDKKLKEYCGY